MNEKKTKKVPKSVIVVAVIFIILAIAFSGGDDSNSDSKDEKAEVSQSQNNEEKTEDNKNAEEPKKNEEKENKQGKDSSDTKKDEKKEKKESKKDYIKSCKKYKYKKVLRNPDKYIGKRIKIEVKISSVHEKDFLTTTKYYFARSNDEYDMWLGDEYGIFDKRDSKNPKLLEDDVIEVYGEIAKPEETKSLIVNSQELFCIDMKYVKLIKE